MPTYPKSEGPELINYLDITGGKWDNLTYAGSPRARVDIPGRFKIPFTPLYIGGEVNVGDGPDDLRIFVGTRVDVGPLLAKLIPSTN